MIEDVCVVERNDVMKDNRFVGVNTRSEHITAMLTPEELRVLDKICEDIGHNYGEIIGKALIVYDRLREFVGCEI